ncbi:MAG TPA: cytochrome c maturation protein CcmE [Bacteroidia bacterium]|nr:cytochrome c maturation protein CcmE [Bacteroidia bacterium]
MKSVNIGLLIGIAIVAMIGIVAFSTWGSSASVTQYASFAVAKQTGKDVHVVGKWVMEDRAKYDNSEDLFTFYMQDTTGETALVNFYDPMPANFKSAEKIAIQGKYDGNVFVADKILMKCPSKYGGDMPSELETAVNR